MDTLLSLDKRESDLLRSRSWLLHPWVRHDFGHRWSVRGCGLHHTGHKLLEFFREESVSVGLIVRVGLPEDVSSVSSDALVIRICDFGLGEWWVLCNQNK